RPEECAVQDLGTVGGGDDDQPGACVEPVHLGEHLVERLLALVVAPHRARAAPTPTNISTNSDPESEKKGTPASPATARASSVLPVPGGPTRSTPLGMRPPSFWYLPGALRNSTISLSSALASSTPATSAKVVLSSLRS